MKIVFISFGFRFLDSFVRSIDWFANFVCRLKIECFLWIGVWKIDCSRVGLISLRRLVRYLWLSFLKMKIREERSRHMTFRFDWDRFKFVELWWTPFACIVQVLRSFYRWVSYRFHLLLRLFRWFCRMFSLFVRVIHFLSERNTISRQLNSKI